MCVCVCVCVFNINMSWFIIHRIQLLPLILIFKWGACSVTRPENMADVMGVHRMSNEEQCRRLCWYRKLCRSYSYIPVSSSINNCVHHADSQSLLDQMPEGWKRKTVTGSGIVNTCTSRPCADTEVCSPVDGSLTTTPRCLPFPATCPKSHARPDVTIVPVDRAEQGQLASVTCQPGFVLVLQGVPNTVQCLVTSKWTDFDGYCEQPTIPYRHRILSNITTGWQMCVRGSFSLITDRFGVSFLAENVTANKYDIPLRVAFRFNTLLGKTAIWSILKNSISSYEKYIGNHTMESGNFSLTLQSTGDGMNMTLVHNTTEYFPFSFEGKVNVTDLQYVQIDQSINLTMLNTGLGC